MSNNFPKKFGRFEAEGVIGKGGMGVVIRAKDHVIGRAVAIKVLRMEEDVGSQAAEALRSRFEQEFRSAGTLSHPSIVTIYDVGQEEELTYIAMELVEGPSLQRILESGEVLSLDEILTITGDLSEGLDHAHAAGIIHRDIKPANILFSKERRAKITDFGVAKVRSMDITMTGTLVGTPGYMSPEQILGKKISGASDQFSLAVMVYQMLTGRLPFHANEPATVLYKIAHEEPQPPHGLNPNLPQALSPVLLRALAKDPQERYATCSEMARALRHAAGRDTGRFVPQAVVAGETLQFDSASMRAPGSGRAPGYRHAEPQSQVRRHPAPPGDTAVGHGGRWHLCGRGELVAAPEHRGSHRDGRGGRGPPPARWLVHGRLPAAQRDAGRDAGRGAGRDGDAGRSRRRPHGDASRASHDHRVERAPRSDRPPRRQRARGKTPVNVELMPGQTYDLDLSLAGYEPASRRIWRPRAWRSRS